MRWSWADHPEELTALQRAADQAGIPAASLVRRWVAQGLAGGTSSVARAEALETTQDLQPDMDRLRRQLTGTRG